MLQHICRPDIATDLDEAAAGDPSAEANGHAEAQSAATAFARGPDETAEAYAKRVFCRVFEEDINTVLSMEVCPALLQLLPWLKDASKYHKFRFVNMQTRTGTWFSIHDAGSVGNKGTAQAPAAGRDPTG